MKNADDKFDGQIGVKCEKETELAIKRIAGARGIEPPQLMRQAAYAIIRYAALYGDKSLPLDMAITQQTLDEMRQAQAAIDLAAKKRADSEGRAEN